MSHKLDTCIPNNFLVEDYLLVRPSSKLHNVGEMMDRFKHQVINKDVNVTASLPNEKSKFYSSLKINLEPVEGK